MKQIAFSALFTFLTCTSFAQWTIDKNHSKFTFIALHHGISELDGYFKKFDGKITSTKDDLSDAVFDISIETASLNTDLEMRDNHLRSEDMFNVTKFPVMTFISTSLKKISGNKYTLIGDLTIKGITKSISMDVTMNGPTAHPDPNNKTPQLGMKALATIKRSDFGIGSKLPVVMVGDDIQIRATGEFQKK